MLFGIIFAIIGIAFVVFFGYDQIASFIGISSEASMKQQISDFEKEVRNVNTLAMGSVNRFNFKVYAGVEKVCFVDSEDPSPEPANGWDPDNLMERAIINNKYNMIIFNNDGFRGDFIQYLKPDINFCIDRTSDLLLENEGSYVSIRD